MLHYGLFANTFKFYYRQGVSNFYTVDNFGNLKYIEFDLVCFNAKYVLNV